MTDRSSPAYQPRQFADERSENGAFQRQEDAFGHWVSDDGSTPYPAEPGRYHLYVSLACPWAHRIVIARRLKGLERAIGMTVVDPIRNDEDGWAFREGPGCSTDPVNGFSLLKEAYLATDPDYRGRVTVPVLWDKRTGRIVSNNDDHLLRMCNGAFRGLARRNRDLDLYPERWREEIDALNERVYETVNDGVYKAGFASTQAAYEEAALALFETLDELEARLERRRYLFGDQIVETDIRLFVTLIRFDAVYHGHFKCNLRRIRDYPQLDRYARDLASWPEILPTISYDHIKRHYYVTHTDINPAGIVPVGPADLP